MEIEILNERENPLLKRKEVRFNVIYEGAVPSLKEVRGKLLSVLIRDQGSRSSEDNVLGLNSNEKLTVVDGIKPKFGRTVAKGYVKIYLDENGMKAEPKHRLKKNFEEKKPKEEKPAETKEPEKKETVTEKKPEGDKKDE